MDGVLKPPPVETVETVEACMRAGAGLTPAPVETVETVEASTGGDTGGSASLRLAGWAALSARVYLPGAFGEVSQAAAGWRSLYHAARPSVFGVRLRNEERVELPLSSVSWHA